MKLKITIFLNLLCFSLFAQQKTTGLINLSSNMTTSLTLNNGTATATLTLSGPNDRWFALQFGSFSGGMESGSDLVYWNGTILVDAVHGGIGVTPTNDPINNWVLVSNMDNTPSTGLRTLVYSRPFNTGDSNDFTFNYADTNIDLAWASHGSASFNLAYHGGSRGVLLNTATTLDVVKFSLDSAHLYPNPTNGDFTVKTKTSLTQISIYTLTGAFVKSITVENGEDTAEVGISGLQSGVYLIELINDTEKSWKKIIVN
jgi:hypothetical protein